MRTFNDDKVFSKHYSSEQQAKEAALQACSPRIRQLYAWGIHPESPLPSSYIFPKRKKLWAKARPVITFSGTVFSPLLTVVATLLNTMANDVYPEGFHFRDVFTTFRDLKKFFQSFQERFDKDDYYMDNDDLSGFYTSVPQDRILKAVTQMVAKYVHKYGIRNVGHYVFTVMDKKHTTDGRVIRGRARTETRSHFVHYQDILDIVEFSLISGIFTSMGTVYSQTRGSCIGSPISPVLCSMTVTFEEYMWQQTFATLRLSSMFITRYVDNRLILSPQYARDHPAMQRFRSLSFYVAPVSLEPENSMDLLGFAVDVVNKQIRHNTPDQDWQFKSPRSAGSTKLILSGFVSRVHIVCRCSYPTSVLRQDLQRLADEYVRRGFSIQALRAMARKPLQQYRLHGFRLK